MTANQRRRRAVERILGEIDLGVDKSDRIAAIMHIQAAEQCGEISERDAQRLTSMLLDVLGGTFTGLRRIVGLRR